MKAATERKIIRWLHIIASIPVIGYIYGPVKDFPNAVLAIKWVILVMDGTFDQKTIEKEQELLVYCQPGNVRQLPELIEAVPLFSPACLLTGKIKKLNTKRVLNYVAPQNYTGKIFVFTCDDIKP